MLNFKVITRKIVKNNKDVVALYRTKIYLSNNVLVKFKLFRYLILAKIFFEKAILKVDISEKINKLENNIPHYAESNISKRRKLEVALKSVVEKEVTFIDILDVMVNTKVCEEDLPEGFQADLYELNLYGKTIYDVLSENNKEIVFLLDDNKIDKKSMENFLEENQITKYKEIINYSEKQEERNQELSKIIEEKFNKNTKFVYVGEFFKEKITDDQKDLMMIVYEKCGFWGKKFRPKNDKSMQMSVYSSMLSNKLHEGLHSYSRAYEFGYCYGGIISYYVLVQMVKNKTTFIKEYDKLKKQIIDKFENEKMVQEIFDLIFPKVVNNFIYDGTENRENIGLDDINLKKQRSIQQGIIDFSEQYENALVDIIGSNEVQYTQIENIFEFLLNSKNTKRMLKNI